jgi:hypothetical protein
VVEDQPEVLAVEVVLVVLEAVVVQVVEEDNYILPYL